MSGYWVSLDQVIDEGWRRAKNHHSRARRSKHQRMIARWWVRRCLWNLRAGLARSQLLGLG